MMDFLQLGLFIFIGGFIGWVTNKIAIKMLFRPIRPVRLLFFQLQGVLPKRKEQIATSIGETVEAQFVNKEELLEGLLDEETKKSILKQIRKLLVEKIKEVVPSMILAMLGQGLDDLVRKLIAEHGDDLLSQLIDSLKNNDNVMPVKAIVTDKINQLDMLEFEALVINIVKKELRHIETVGLVLGVVIGMAQYGITLLLG
jgi:uncharacterized membrane protein YheB (UPF0754 family)